MLSQLYSINILHEILIRNIFILLILIVQITNITQKKMYGELIASRGTKILSSMTIRQKVYFGAQVIDAPWWASSPAPI